ncbi:MAG: hypothetical protein AAFO99_05725 [Bacteroidota bacterium]
MKRIGLIFAFISLISCSEDETPSIMDQEGIDDSITFVGEVDWIRSFGGTGEETAQSIITTADGGYAVLGYTNSLDGDISDKDTNVNDYWLLKLDVDGNLQWNKTYGGSKDDRGQSVIQTNDGGYAIVGYAMSSDGDGSNNEGFHDNWILKLDASGEVEWERSFGFSGHDHSYDVVQTTDGGFFFVGFLDVTSSGGAGGEGKGASTRHGVGEFWGTKLDAEGNLEWRRFFGGTNNDRAYGVVQSNDGGLVITGSSESADFDISGSKGSYDFWVIKVTSNGDLVWESSFGGSGIDKSYGISKTDDNSYVITGNTFSIDTDISKNNGESDIWLVKITDSGELVWEKTFGGLAFDAAQSVNLQQDGGFVIAGNSKSMDTDVTANSGENDVWVIKTDKEGNLVWEKTFGGSGLDFGFDAIENRDKSIVLVGESGSTDFPDIQSKGSSDLVVIKIK